MLSVTKQEAQEAPMNVLYAVSARDNPLYRGKFGLHGRYQTYGQHSFIYDLIAAASRRGVNVTLLVEGLSEFPLAEPLKEYSRVFEMDERAEVGPIDLILLDEPTDKLVASLPAGSPIICIIHRKTSAYSQEIQDRCDQFLCMTEAALEYQSTKIPPKKLVMVHHGIDLQRFRLTNETRVQRKAQPNLLFYTRLDREEVTMWRILEQLLRCDVRLTMLGDGDAFWKISDQYGRDLTLINHIPCHSIHNFLHHFDIVASAGRGVLEALACGLPALCAGYEYGGPLLPNNIQRHMETNITGYRMAADLAGMRQDIDMAMSLERDTCRLMASEHGSVETFLDKLGIGETGVSPVAV